MLDRIAAVSRVAGRPLEPEFGEPRVGDVKHSFADIGLARKLLGYEPRVGFDEGIGRTFAWFVEDVPDVPA